MMLGKQMEMYADKRRGMQEPTVAMAKKMGTGLKDYSVLNLAINGIEVLWCCKKKHRE